jgi:hypothetical protein
VGVGEDVFVIVGVMEAVAVCVEIIVGLVVTVGAMVGDPGKTAAQPAEAFVAINLKLYDPITSGMAELHTSIARIITSTIRIFLFVFIPLLSVLALSLWNFS